MVGGPQLAPVLRHVDGDPFGGEGGQDKVAGGLKIDPAKLGGVEVLGEEGRFGGHPPFTVSLCLKGGH